MAEPQKHRDTAHGSTAPLNPPSCHQCELREDDFDPKYWKDLFEYTRPSDQEPLESQLQEPPVGDFQRLQMMNITHLMHQLARLKATINRNHTTSAEEMSRLQLTLHQYANAIRDYKNIESLPNVRDNVVTSIRGKLGARFPYLVEPYKGERNQPYDTSYRTFEARKPPQARDPIREVLRKFLPVYLSYSKGERRGQSYGSGEAPETYSRFVDSVARFIIGTLGGCALIVPMVVMSLDPSLTKSLVVVSVSVVLFALAVSLIFKTDNKDTVMATATYAAVLVVFVGNSGGGAGVAVNAQG